MRDYTKTHDVLLLAIVAGSARKLELDGTPNCQNISALIALLCTSLS